MSHTIRVNIKRLQPGRGRWSSETSSCRLKSWNSCRWMGLASTRPGSTYVESKERKMRGDGRKWGWRCRVEEGWLDEEKRCRRRWPQAGIYRKSSLACSWLVFFSALHFCWQRFSYSGEFMQAFWDWKKYRSNLNIYIHLLSNMRQITSTESYNTHTSDRNC